MKNVVIRCRTIARLTGVMPLLLILSACTLSLNAQSTSFTVTVNKSTAENPNGRNANSEVFYIDGVEAKELTLSRGTTYTFVMNNVPTIHPFYISTSSVGAGALPYSTGVTGQFATGSNTLTFTPGAGTPNLLYYQCDAHQYMGWKINVVGKVAEDTIRFRALLAADNEVPAAESSASGEVTAMLVGNQLMLEGDFDGLAGNVMTSLAGGAHIHRGYAGENGPIEHPLTIGFSGKDSVSGTFDSKANTFTLTEAQQAALRERRMYVNVHSTAHPGGELRGQFLPASAEVWTANLSGRAEVPANMSRAWGGAVIERYGDTIVVTGSFNGLESPLATNIAGGAHIHMEDHDTNGPVIFPLSIITNNPGDTSGVIRADSNTFILEGDQIEALLGMRTYLNIHSTGRTGGEIRGQIVPHSAVVFEAWLAGLNEVPAMAGTARGGAIAILNGRQLHFGGNFSGLESDLAVNIAGGAHIHRGGPDENGPVIYPLPSTMADARNGTFRVEDNVVTLTPGAIDSLHQGMFYVNIHSMDRQGGELRGQLLPSVDVAPSATAIISPAPGAAIPIPSDTSVQLTGLWGAAADVNGNEIAYTWQVAADPGFNAILFTTPATTDTSFSISFGNILALLEEAGIDPEVIGPITVHHRVISSDGSLWSMSGVEQLTIGQSAAPEGGFRAMLAGHNEVPAVESRAAGSISARLAGDTLKVSGSFDGLGSNVNTAIRGGAHLHVGLAGLNGPIAFDLKATLDGDQRGGSFAEGENSFVLNAEQKAALSRQQMYVNIHTVDRPGGELRGQLVPDASTTWWTNLSGRAELPPNLSPGTGSMLLTLGVEDTVFLSGAFAGLESDLVTGIAAHIHRGGIDTNGSVLVPLLIAPGTGIAGIFDPLSNNAPPGIIDLGLLASGEFYVNVHTQGHPGGELRGQLVEEGDEILEAWLAGTNEVIPNGHAGSTSGATGSVVAILDSNELRLGGSFSGLSSPFSASHIHIGGPGTNGNVAIPLNVTVTAADQLSGKFRVENNTYTLTPAQVDALLDGGMYVNVHSQSHPGGEIRGQLLVSTNVPPAEAILLGPAAAQVVTLDQNLSGSLDVRGRRSTDPNGNQIVYGLQLSTDATFNGGFMTTYWMTDTGMALPFTTLAAFADSAGVEIDGEGTTLYARLVVSDGSLRQVSTITEFTLKSEISGVKERKITGGGLLTLEGVTPNPVVRTGEIRVGLESAATLRVEIYNAGGESVQAGTDRLYAAGRHSLNLDLESLHSGTYHYRIVATAGEETEVRTGQFTLLR